jgi:predicted XRE-type DNA-binding protein
MTAVQEVRYCANCATRLARDNTSARCSACARTAGDLILGAPDMPREFWYTDRMRDAFATRHMGQVIDAYRHHPLHGRQLSQAEVADWLGITQPALSRMEKKVDPPKDLPKLISYAQTLGMPAELLWFKLPDVAQDETTTSPAPTHRVDQTGTLTPSRAATYTRDQVLLIPPGRDERDEPVDRREFLTASAGALAAAPMLNLLTALDQAALPTEVRPIDIAQVRSAARLFTRWSHTYGGGVVRQAVIAQLRYSAELLEARCPEQLRPELFSAVGDLSGVCGFMAFDGYQFDDAKRMFVFGLSCAEEAGDWHLRARLHRNLAQQTTWRGDPDNGVTYTDMALVRPDRLTASELAWLHTARGRALASLGRTQEALRAIGHADQAFAARKPGDDPPWMGHYDEPEHAASTGYCLFPLALRGTALDEAARRLRAAMDGYGTGYVRSKAASGITLATLLLSVGDPHEGLTVGNQVLDTAQGLQSLRVTDQLRQLRQAAGRHEAIPDARELGQRVTELVGAE